MTTARSEDPDLLIDLIRRSPLLEELQQDALDHRRDPSRCRPDKPLGQRGVNLRGRWRRTGWGSPVDGDRTAATGARALPIEWPEA